jgi:hypothetical protein
MDNSFYPAHGGAYRCRRGNKATETVKGYVYVYYRPDDTLIRLGKRMSTILLNGYNALRQPGAFDPSIVCPVCTSPITYGEKGEPSHDCYECEEKRRNQAIARGE